MSEEIETNVSRVVRQQLLGDIESQEVMAWPLNEFLGGSSFNTYCFPGEN